MEEGFSLPRILLIVLALGLLALMIHRFRKLPAARKKQFAKYFLILLVVGMFVGLALTGRLHWLFALIASIVPMIPRFIGWLVRILPSLQPLLRAFQSRGSPYRQPQMETRYLRVSLNQASGEMEGVVLLGHFRGRLLKSMDLDELNGLLAECQQDDVESAALLMAYMDRYHYGWRKQHNSSGHQQYNPSGGMSREEACEILNVGKNANREEIIEAHRRLMQKLHPDRGGSDYLAAKINQAKDTLLS